MAHQSDLSATFDRCCDSLYRFVVVRTSGDSALADDIMQQVWLAGVESGQSVTAGDAEAWFKGVARKLLLAYRRTTFRRQNNLQLTGTELARRLEREPTGHELVTRQEVRDLLLQALTALPSDAEQLLIRRYFCGHAVSQLAEEMGITTRAVEGRLRRARKALRDSLVDLDVEG